jgi:hypothetical protein
LAGEAPLSPDVTVIATVATDFLSQQLCLVPNRITDNTMHVAYGLMTNGLYFRFILDENQPPPLRAISCMGEGPLNLIFARDASDKVWPAVNAMMETTVPKGQLAESKPPFG